VSLKGWLIAINTALMAIVFAWAEEGHAARYRKQSAARRRRQQTIRKAQVTSTVECATAQFARKTKEGNWNA
jgi:hypothetical protein